MSRVGSAFSGLNSLLRGKAEPQPTARQPIATAVTTQTIDSLVRTQPEKYGRAIAPELAPTKMEPAAVEAASSHVSAAAAVKEKSLISEPVTLDMLVAEFRRAQRITTQRVLFVGALCERWIRQQLSERTALDRGTAIKKIRETLAEAKLEKKEARVDLFVRCHWVAVLLGGWRDDSQESRAASNELSFSALRLFPILIQRDKSERWQLTAKYAEAGKALWARAVREHLSAAVIDEELSKIVPARTLPIRKHRAIRLSVIEKLLARLKPEDLPKVHGLVDQVSAKMTSTAAA